MRTLLRLEFLYQQLCFNIEQPSEWGSRSAITNLLDIVTILGRGDVRGDVLKELERQIGIYDRYQNVAGIDERLLRFVRKVGYDGYPDFQRDLRREVQERMEGLLSLSETTATSVDALPREYGHTVEDHTTGPGS